MELSTTSNTRWCRPRSAVSPMYMPGRLRTASRPSRTLMFSAPYSDWGGVSDGLIAMWKNRKFILRRASACHRAGGVLRAPAEVRRGRSEAHRHEHVGVAGVLRATKQTGTDLVRQAHLDRVPGGMRVQDLDEVVSVEPDGDRIPGI